MEFVIVNFTKARAVLVDGNICGKTNVVLQLEAGIHTLSLAPPADFKPRTITIILDPNCSGPLCPREITFERA